MESDLWDLKKIVDTIWSKIKKKINLNFSGGKVLQKSS